MHILFASSLRLTPLRVARKIAPGDLVTLAASESCSNPHVLAVSFYKKKLRLWTQRILGFGLRPAELPKSVPDRFVARLLLASLALRVAYTGAVFTSFRLLASAKIYTFFKAFLFKLILLFSLLVPTICFAQNDYFQKFENHTVHYSVFSSTAISEDIAQRYGLVRGKNRVLVNIAVVPNDKEFGGVAADISGIAANLMQQQKKLEFQEIKEPDAIYYLASLRHTDREFFHFTININPQGQERPYQVKFTKELYVNP